LGRVSAGRAAPAVRTAGRATRAEAGATCRGVAAILVLPPGKTIAARVLTVGGGCAGRTVGCLLVRQRHERPSLTCGSGPRYSGSTWPAAGDAAEPAPCWRDLTILDGVPAVDAVRYVRPHYDLAGSGKALAAPVRCSLFSGDRLAPHRKAFGSCASCSGWSGGGLSGALRPAVSAIPPGLRRSEQGARRRGDQLLGACRQRL